MSDFPLLMVAEDAAVAGGEILKQYFKSDALEKQIKGDGSLVTQADRLSEEAIIAVIRNYFPDHGIVGEEGGARNPDSDWRWHIDPIDGTSNFATGILYHFCVSVAVERRGELLAAVVYNPLLGQFFAAERGSGAFLNNTPIHVSEATIARSTFSLGRGRNPRDLNNWAQLLTPAASSAHRLRILGACALDMAYVAAGAFGGYINLGSKTWDYAAGALLIQEAGGMITGLRGEPWHLGEDRFIASNGPAHAELLELVRRTLT